MCLFDPDNRIIQGVAQEKGLGLLLVFLDPLWLVQGLDPLVKWVLVDLQVCFYDAPKPLAEWVDLYFWFGDVNEIFFQLVWMLICF